MFINFLKVTIRNLYREKMYAAINIAGLSIAIACCIILGLYLRSELTYDRHNIRHKEIFRVENEFNVNGKIVSSARTSISLGSMLSEEYDEVKGFVRFYSPPENVVLIRHGDNAFFWENHFMVDDNVFEVFTHDIISGDPKTALVDPSSIAISESFAKKYFGETNPIGETVSDEVNTYRITLVFADLPENSHLKYDFLTSLNQETLAEPDNVTLRRQRLISATFFTYLLMPEDYDIQDFNDISDLFFKRHMSEIGKARNITWRSWLQPLADIHLRSDVRADFPTGNMLYLYAFTAVAIFILLVACINYMNLATARAVKRAKEVDMRKILGAGRAGIILQFLGESVFFALIALFIGIVFVELTLNLMPINELLGKSLTLNLNQEPVLLAWMVIFGLVIGLFSGIYPALYLSSLLPLSALVKVNRPGKGNIRLREMLVLIQFIISVTVIACTLLMALQMRYVSHKSLGFDKENRLVITLHGSDLINKIPTIKNELLKNSSILGVSSSSHIIGQSSYLNLAMIDNNDGIPESMTLKHILVGNDFLEVMGIELLTGRDLSETLFTDTGTNFIVNETMVKQMGWKDPLGKHINAGAGMYNGRVIGVVKDFHFVSLHRQIEPFAIHGFINTPGENPYMQRLLLLHITEDEISRTLKFIEEKIAEFDLKHPFELEFLDDSLNQLYSSEQRMMKLIGIFAGICIFISCLGLFGLAAFNTEQRTKEIGIRKVLGASTWQIITMLSRGILLLVFIGAIIASLVAYYAMDEWLTIFDYRIGINPLVFLVSTGIAACVAFITVALQSYKTARANPINALRYE